MAGAQRRMARERQLLRRREDAHAVVGIRLLGRHDERRLGQVRPVREALHLLAGETLAVEHDRDRVAEERPAGKDVDLLEAAHALFYFRMRSRLWCESVKLGSHGRSSISSETSSMRGHARSFRLRVTITWSVAVYQ